VDTLSKIHVGNNENGSNNGTTTFVQNIMLNWKNTANPLFWESQP